MGGSDLPYCILDKEYPAYDIAVKISQDALFLKKYADIADQSADDLVQDITKPQEDLLTTSTTLELPRDHLLMTLLIGLDLRVTFAHLMLTMQRSLVPSMLKATGESSSSTSLRDMAMVTITTLRQLVLRPAFSLTLPVVSLPLATSQSALRSMFTTECFLLIPVTHTEVSSLIPTSSLVPVLATFPPNLIQTKTKA